MEEQRAQRIVSTLRARNVFAHVKLPHAGITQYGVRVVLPDGREAVWDNDGTAGLEAQIMRNGILVGFVEAIPGSAPTADSERPVGRSRPTRPTVHGTPPPSSQRPQPSLGQRLRGGFRY